MITIISLTPFLCNLIEVKVNKQGNYLWRAVQFPSPRAPVNEVFLVTDNKEMHHLNYANEYW